MNVYSIIMMFILFATLLNTISHGELIRETYGMISRSKKSIHDYILFIIYVIWFSCLYYMII